MNRMAVYRLTGLAAVVAPPQRNRPWCSIEWIAAWFARAAMALLVIASSGAAVRAQAEEMDVNKVPIEIVRFERGASSKVISGAVIRGERSLYSIDARAGQRLTLSISALEDNAVFQIYPPGAQPKHGEYGVEISGAKALRGAAEGEDAQRWSGKLEQSGTYLVVVGSSRGNATYTLRVTIR